MTRHLLYLGLVFLLANCAVTTQPVHMVNPQTGATVQCGPYNMRGTYALSAAMHETQCIQDYKEQGYVRVPSPK